VLGVDLVDQMGVVVRLLSIDGVEHHIQIPSNEAHGLADMLAIAIARMPKPQDAQRN
jgi:hypothetical protein